MIELIVKNYLDTVLTVPVYMEKPEQAPTKYVLIEQLSRRETNQVSYSSVAIQSYAESQYKASELNESVIRAMRDIITVPEVPKCSLNNSYPYTDTAKKQYRCQAVFDLVFYDD